VPLISTRALILHGIPYGDTSRILRLLTADHGLRSVIAKGAQRPKNRFGGILEPFTEGEAQFNLREGRDLFILAGFSLIRSRQGIGRDLGGFAGASLISELLLRSATEEPSPELFRTACLAMDDLAGSDDGSRRSLAWTWYIVSMLGYEPQMGSCVVCGRDFGTAEESRFDVASGGAVCRSCRSSGRIIPGYFRAEVASMATGAAGEMEWTQGNRRRHAALLHAFLSAHLASERPLKSLGMFLDQLR
jgi:DNA repair protein RecO (recombination protein O)